MPDDRELEQRIVALLAEPAHQGHPLHTALNELYQAFGEVVHQLERIVHISDRYQHVTREERLSLHERYSKQLRQLEKLARISDRYQLMMRDLNEALKDASQQDPLTGIGNRRMLSDAIKVEVARADRTGRPLVVVMADVDRFKDVNDAHGHEIGDQALIEVARAIRVSMREYDLCGRWGGEEFMVIMPEIGLADGMRVVERIRKAIVGLEFRVEDQVLALSASFGIAEYRSGESASDTINRADAALLEAKRSGRNCCAIAE